ncbi:N-formylglutamate amidohydrolase [Desulfofustis limnaeus]|jgi:N-formylglutamate amidohydrolase|uniref:N-formylglutamate amidohydrolase n=1 Tax=Desulfofustis limnaeus TaxID=2740163 RepID=A0ABN6M5R0_9BACT|nr:N-formylglutamate amidohydrolase [Desulfofustis limnaeus]MDX9895338.1 N-formylglutamate amidohydrolase [Desulfofustis sp.]BDD86442.1 hypothetical protein DPPLL_08070 [Desulfofustis limnaeus]
MDLLSEADIIAAIRSGTPVSALVDSGAFHIVVPRYIPAVATAIHDGHEVPGPVEAAMLVSVEERCFEEDPYTGRIADTVAISLVMHHSRYYYDVNRRPAACIYDEAWGKKVWRSFPDEQARAAIVDLHASYFRVLDALLSALEQRFPAVVLYDLHSYNYGRLRGEPPLFNIGTHFIDSQQWHSLPDRLAEGLRSIAVPGIANRTVFDEVFVGKGYQAEHIRSHHDRCLCLPLEIKKVFLDEVSGRLCVERFQALQNGLTEVLASHAAACAQQWSAGDFSKNDFVRT